MTQAGCWNTVSEIEINEDERYAFVRFAYRIPHHFSPKYVAENCPSHASWKYRWSTSSAIYCNWEEAIQELKTCKKIVKRLAREYPSSFFCEEFQIIDRKTHEVVLKKQYYLKTKKRK